MSDMFCFQCQEAAMNTGCTRVGVCGKKPEVANLQDLLIWVTKGYSEVLTRLRAEGTPVEKEENHRVSLNLFTTITNANFDPEAIRVRINETIDATRAATGRLKNTEALSEAATYGEKDPAAQDEKAKTVGVLSTENEDIRSLRELITYGVKGLAAYTKHANALLQDNEEVDQFMQEALAKTLDDSLSVDELVQLTLDTGAHGVKGMATLDAANTGAYGNPEITKVNLGTRGNPGILVSGHDLRDFEMLLEQSKDSGVDIYTHSEMLPANYYPAFKKYDHFVGNYGGSWWHQREEFDSFN